MALVFSACDATPVSTAEGAGLQAWMRVSGAQYFRGAMPGALGNGSPDGGAGVTVAAASLATNTVVAGAVNKPLVGSLSPGATAAALGLVGDSGYWILLAGTPNVDSPTFPAFAATLSFADTMPPGPYALVVRAANDAGTLGAPFSQPLTVTTSSPIPPGAGVVHLAWDTEADLDLHVVDPRGVEIFYRNISSYVPPAPGQDPNATSPDDDGVLDFDSNAACIIDGRRQENVVWKKALPPGHYTVRVDTKSLCGEVLANWTVTARGANGTLAEARGTSYGTDTRFAHDRGAGLLAVEFDVP